MDRFFGFEAIPGIAARFYSWATARRPIVRDLFDSIEEAAARIPALARILDVGTGPGLLPLRLARRLPDAKVEGVDLSPAMVRISRAEAVRAEMADRVSFTEGNASSLPFPDASFDLVISTLSLHHWRDRDGGIREIHRVLKPGGTAWIYDIRKDTPPDVERWAVQRYGRWSALLFLRVVRLHSFVTDAEASSLLGTASARFSRSRVEARGLFLRLVLEK